MSKKYFLINLNQGESKEARQERIKEQSRWAVFTIIVLLFLAANGSIFYINAGYNKLIEKKKTEIALVKAQLSELQSKGKNISKRDIQSLAKIEEERFMWAQILETLGKLTPEDIALTGIQYKFGKWTINGIATIYEDVKDFDIVNNYLSKLKNSKKFSENFSRIKFSEYSRQRFRGQEIIMFTITGQVKSKPTKMRGRK